MKNEALREIVETLTDSTRTFAKPLVDTIIKEYGTDPFLILISCLLSLRAKDIVTINVCHALFAVAQTPKEILAMPVGQLETLLFTTGFYKNKAQTLRSVSKTILENFNGVVPQTKQELLPIKGIGRKTANLVLGLAFNIPTICVDTHVHRISNRLGIIRTKNPGETEEALENILPRKHWIRWNKLLVMWGQNICVPLSPFCSKCSIETWCKRVDVTRSR